MLNLERGLIRRQISSHLHKNPIMYLGHDSSPESASSTSFKNPICPAHACMIHSDPIETTRTLLLDLEIRERKTHFQSSEQKFYTCICTTRCVFPSLASPLSLSLSLSLSIVSPWLIVLLLRLKAQNHTKRDHHKKSELYLSR